MEEQELQDGKWYVVHYDSLGVIYRAPALYKKNVGCFYSYEFAGIPARHLQVIREINTEANNHVEKVV
jgi:hypothetical protein